MQLYATVAVCSLWKRVTSLICRLAREPLLAVRDSRPDAYLYALLGHGSLQTASRKMWI